MRKPVSQRLLPLLLILLALPGLPLLGWMAGKSLLPGQVHGRAVLRTHLLDCAEGIEDYSLHAKAWTSQRRQTLAHADHWLRLQGRSGRRGALLRALTTIAVGVCAWGALGLLAAAGAPASASAGRVAAEERGGVSRSELRFVDQRMFGGLSVSVGGAELPPEIAHIARDPMDPEFDDAAFVARLRRHGPYNELDRNTLYGGGAKGYIDYPVLVEA